MLIGIKQNDPRLLKPIQKYGCLFLSFAEVSPDVFQGDLGIQLLNNIWEEAVEKKYISGDLNGDGDIDDDGESEVLNHNGLASLFGLNVKYDGIHHKAHELIPPEVAFAFGQFFWKSSHFAVLNKQSKEVTFDSFGYSNTVKNGKLISMRWYYAN